MDGWPAAEEEWRIKAKNWTATYTMYMKIPQMMYIHVYTYTFASIFLSFNAKYSPFFTLILFLSSSFMASLLEYEEFVNHHTYSIHLQCSPHTHYTCHAYVHVCVWFSGLWIWYWLIRSCFSFHCTAFPCLQMSDSCHEQQVCRVHVHCICMYVHVYTWYMYACTCIHACIYMYVPYMYIYMYVL